jgi:ABC-type polysaccharide/polyol phosphate export permease
MFATERSTSRFTGAATLIELVYHGTVRSVRRTHGNAMIGLLLNIAQTAVFVLVFWVMFELLGMRGLAIRGDYLLYLFSGIYLFLVHTKAMSAVVGSEGPASPMMQHAPMNTAVAILSAALGALYLQLLALVVILGVYHAAFVPLTFEQPFAALAMVLLSWFTGVAVGLVFLAMKPWNPDIANMLSQLYARANMIASGKMFVANMLPGTMIAMFDWNPLFHLIDQCRGFLFVNYNPHFSSVAYPVIVGVIILILGLMGEFYTRRHASASWNARR